MPDNSSRVAGAYFRIEPSIQEALVEGRPVVALESTIITHGMAYPQNLSMAREVEKIVMRNGAVPATIEHSHSRLQVAFSGSHWGCMTCCPIQGLSGGTTVSGTMIAAHKAGIPVFVTGGIGGVHRGGENSKKINAYYIHL
ncbi:UNVERIFIED_CONTAM: hypothetical protein H355_002210 [Colinus virginianus]|nr:hypothetical protein H355_002210 [Colinus virginianus]